MLTLPSNISFVGSLQSKEASCLSIALRPTFLMHVFKYSLDF